MNKIDINQTKQMENVYLLINFVESLQSSIQWIKGSFYSKRSLNYIINLIIDFADILCANQIQENTDLLVNGPKVYRDENNSSLVIILSRDNKPEYHEFYGYHVHITCTNSYFLKNEYNLCEYPYDKDGFIYLIAATPIKNDISDLRKKSSYYIYVTKAESIIIKDLLYDFEADII